MILEVQSKEELKELILGTDDLILVNLWASWCRPCHVMQPILEAAEEKYGSEMKFCKVDTEEHEDIADLFAPPGIPTYVFCKKGKEVGRISGYRNKKTFLELIQEYLDKYGGK